MWVLVLPGAGVRRQPTLLPAHATSLSFPGLTHTLTFQVREASFRNPGMRHRTSYYESDEGDDN